jgi:hypothetical protein
MLRSSGSDVSVTLTISTLVGLDEGSVNGGWVVVRLDGDELVLSDGNQSETLSLGHPNQGGSHV